MLGLGEGVENGNLRSLISIMKRNTFYRLTCDTIWSL
jgi:hypothetical protein